MHHSECFYDSWCKGCSYKNKLCLTKYFSLLWFVIVLIPNLVGISFIYRIPDLQLQIARLNHCYDATVSDMYEETRAQVNSLHHLSWRTGEMSQ